ncbi:hypothetical protein ABPG72_020256 [Tetrahymena utriculariae]
MNKLIAIALILSMLAISIRANVLGNDVACGTASNTPASIAAVNCNNCGATSDIQNLFAPDGTTFQSNCQFSDCSSVPTTLNGWICNSCNGVSGSKIPSGQFFYGSTCSSTCTGGNQANGYICTSNSTVLFFAMLLSLLALLF